jgi:hypothetical protein
MSKRDKAIARLEQMSPEELQRLSDWLDTLPEPEEEEEHDEQA